jgi:hypothetical protein
MPLLRLSAPANIAGKGFLVIKDGKEETEQFL